MLRRRRLPCLLILLILIIAAVGLWAGLQGQIRQPLPEARAALDAGAALRIDDERWLVFAPQAPPPTRGFIFYPGGLVVAEAYAPLGRALAEAGYLAVLVPMPLHLAVLQPAAAADVMAAYPEIEAWVLGGHSLGGAMAARFAYEQPGRLDGLVLLAAYPEAHADLSQRALAVATIYAELDGLATVAEIERSFPLLPAHAQKILIEGGNHAGFGWYGEQAGDRPAAISREAQAAQVLAALLPLMAEAGK